MAVVSFNRHCPTAELQDFRIAEHHGFTFAGRRLEVVRARVAARGIDQLLLLGAERLLDDGAAPLIRQQLLEDDVLVRIDRALHDVLAEPPGGVDDDDAGKAGFSIEREHHPGSGQVGTHHLLNADRQGDLQMIEAVGLPVHDGTVREERSVTSSASPQQFRVAAHIEIGFLLAGETCLRQILGGRAAADGDRQLRCSAALGQFAIGDADRFGDRSRKLCIGDQTPNGRAGRFE